MRSGSGNHTERPEQAVGFYFRSAATEIDVVVYCAERDRALRKEADPRGRVECDDSWAADSETDVFASSYCSGNDPMPSRAGRPLAEWTHFGCFVIADEGRSTWNRTGLSFSGRSRIRIRRTIADRARNRRTNANRLTAEWDRHWRESRGRLFRLSAIAVEEIARQFEREGKSGTRFLRVSDTHPKQTRAIQMAWWRFMLPWFPLNALIGD